MSKQEVIFENPDYIVTPDSDNDKYDVVNRTTGILEYSNSQLPKALAVAQEFHLFLKQRIHEKIEYLNPLFNQPLSEMIDPDEEDEDDDSVERSVN